MISINSFLLAGATSYSYKCQGEGKGGFFLQVELDRARSRVLGREDTRLNQNDASPFPTSYSRPNVSNSLCPHSSLVFPIGYPIWSKHPCSLFSEVCRGQPDIPNQSSKKYPLEKSYLRIFAFKHFSCMCHCLQPELLLSCSLHYIVHSSLCSPSDLVFTCLSNS